MWEQASSRRAGTRWRTTTTASSGTTGGRRSKSSSPEWSQCSRSSAPSNSLLQGFEGVGESLLRRQDAFEEIAVLAHTLEHGIHREGERVETLVHFVPAKRRRHGSPRPWTHGVHP